MRVHYPRTPHLPWSPGAAADDIRTADLSGLTGREVVVTEKLDGENTTVYRDGLHARSLDSAHHPARAWVKALQGRVGAGIPDCWRVCGENLYARHSIAYQNLESWFYGFSVWDGDRCLDWDRTVRFLRGLGIPVPPVLWRGVYDEKRLRALNPDLTRQEGYVVRTVDGFDFDEFGSRVAKWVRPGHVQTDTHWMYASIVENGRGPTAALWDVRSGAPADVPALVTALELHSLHNIQPSDTPKSNSASVAFDAATKAVVSDADAHLGTFGRMGDARLAGVLAALLHGARRATLAPLLAGPLGTALARRVADLVGLYPRLHRPYPDDDRRAGLIRMAFAADLGVLHAVARATLTAAAPASPDETTAAHEQLDWSQLYADDAGLLEPTPFAALRTGMHAALIEDAGLPAHAADRCWAQVREALADGRVSTVEEGVAASWRWRAGAFPQLIQLVGPPGSGKSTFAATMPEADARVSLDELRAAHGPRADQGANPEVLRAGLAALDAALASGGTTVWDATSLTRHQRSLVHSIAARRDALVTHAVLLTDESELFQRNATREHALPPDALASLLRRFDPPYPGEAHRTWYVRDAAVEDVAGALDEQEW